MKVTALIIALLMTGCFAPGQEELRINPGVRYQGNLLMIKNNDAFYYDFVQIKLNDGAFKKDLLLSIPPGEEIRCSLSEFTKLDGERLNIFKYGLNDISISCECSELVQRSSAGDKWKKIGKAFYHGKF